MALTLDNTCMKIIHICAWKKLPHYVNLCAFCFIIDRLFRNELLGFKRFLVAQD